MEKINKPTLEDFNLLIQNEEGINALFDYVSNLDKQKIQAKNEIKILNSYIEKLEATINNLRKK